MIIANWEICFEMGIYLKNLKEWRTLYIKLVINPGCIHKLHLLFILAFEFCSNFI